MKIKELIESSPDTPQGSVSRDLIISKLWITASLKALGLTEFDNIYVLGSWYGAMAVVLKHSSLTYQEIISIDKDCNKVQYFERIIKQKGWNDIESRCADVYELDYQGDDVLVINTSSNDMRGNEWLDPIPAGSVVVIQGKDHQDIAGAVETLEALDEEYPLAETLMLKELSVVDVHGEPYKRFMKIGIR